MLGHLGLRRRAKPDLQVSRGRSHANFFLFHLQFGSLYPCCIPLQIRVPGQHMLVSFQALLEIFEESFCLGDMRGW